MPYAECAPPKMKQVLQDMEKEGSTFGERVNMLLETKNMTQGDLASMVGLNQSAISMLISRSCRPQRRTVEKIANALKVSSEDLWPGFKDD